MILNAGDAYQTVTIVPSDTNPGEVSYVLIVQQPGDKDDKGDDQDLTVYDFDEGEEGTIAMVRKFLNEYFLCYHKQNKSLVIEN